MNEDFYRALSSIFIWAGVVVSNVLKGNFDLMIIITGSFLILFIWFTKFKGE